MPIESANDRTTYMTEMQKCLHSLEEKGFTDHYKVENDRLRCITSNNEYGPQDIKVVNFYRFEGISDPDDMSILYAIETNDGCRGTLVDAYGYYADTETGKFMRKVEIHKRDAHKEKDTSL
jgi:hypothetical protein